MRKIVFLATPPGRLSDLGHGRYLINYHLHLNASEIPRDDQADRWMGGHHNPVVSPGRREERVPRPRPRVGRQSRSLPTHHARSGMQWIDMV